MDLPSSAHSRSKALTPERDQHEGSAVSLSAKANLETVPGLLDTVKAALAAGSGPVRIDASALQAFDTSAIALLLHAQRLAAEVGRTIQLIGAPDKLVQLATLYGVEGLLPPTTPKATLQA